MGQCVRPGGGSLWCALLVQDQDSALRARHRLRAIGNAVFDPRSIILMPHPVLRPGARRRVNFDE